jgi:translocation and assembly module TamB
VVILWSLPIVAGALARTPLARAYAGREATKALKRELGLTARIDEVDIDPSRLAVVVRGVSLDHPTEGRFADAEALRIRPSWWALMRGSLDLHAITIERATLFLKVRDGIIANLPPLPESESSSEDMDLPFNWFRIKESRLVVDAAPYGNGELRGIDIHLDATADEVLRAHVRASAGFVNHATGRDTLQALELAGGIHDQGIDVDLLRFETPEVQLSMRQGRLQLPLGTRYRGFVDLELDLAEPGTWPLGFSLPELTGHLSVQAEINGEEDRPEGRARVRIRDATIDQYGLGKLAELDVHFDRQKVAFEGKLTAIRDAGSVSLDGAVELGESLPMEVHGTATGVGFAVLMEQLGVSDNAIVDWGINGNFSLKGSLDPLDLRGPMRMPTRDFVVLRDAWHQQPRRPIIGVRSARLDGTVTVTADALSFVDVDIAMPTSRLHTDVELSFSDGVHVDAQGVDLGLADISPLIGFPIGGRGTFEAVVDGPYASPAVHGHMRFDDWSFNEFVFGDIDTNFEIDEDMMGVHFARIEAEKNDSRYAVSNAFLDFRNDAFRAGGGLDVERLSLADFYDIFHYVGDERFEPYQGVVTGEAKVEYTMGYPGDSESGTMVAEMSLAIPEAVLDGYAFDQGRFEGSWRWEDHTEGYRGGILTVERLSLRKGAGTVSISGKMGRQGVLDMVAVGDSISIRDTEGLGDRVPGLRGSYAVTALIKGLAPKPRVDIDLTGTGLTLDGEPVGDGRAYVRLTDKSDPWIAEALQWEPGAPPADAECAHGRSGLARGVWPPDPPIQTVEGPQPPLDQPMAFVICGEALGGQLQVDLTVGRTKTYPLRGRVELDELQFGRLLPRDRRAGPMHGSATGRVDFTGGAALSPGTLSGSVALSTLRAGQREVELVNDRPVRLSFDRGAFQVHSARFSGASSRLAITGGGSLHGGLALSVDGRVDVGLLSTLSSTVTDASGEIALGFKVSGEAQRPAIYGHAHVRDATLAVASFPEAVRNVSGQVTFSARRVLLEGFSAEVAGGTVRWGGAANLSGRSIGAYALQIEADGIKLEPRDGIDLEFGARTELAWQKGDDLPRLGGVLRIDRMEYTRPIQMNRTLGDMYARDRASAPTYDPENDLLALDLRVEQTNPLHVRNNLIDAELRLQTSRLPFRLVGTDQRFGLLGNVSVHNGVVRFRDQEFEIRQGDISFSDETRINPVFDIRAVTDVRRTTDQTDWHIGIHAFGSRDEFQFQLTSDPYLTEDDIALLLTVGMTHSELAQLETGELTSTAALEALASVTGVEREVHRALPEIDDFYVASAYSQRTNRTVPQLFIGKRIAENLRLKASTGISESRDFSTGVELQLDEETSVEAVYNNQNSIKSSQIGNVGVDLKWRLEFD